MEEGGGGGWWGGGGAWGGGGGVGVVQRVGEDFHSYNCSQELLGDKLLK